MGDFVYTIEETAKLLKVSKETIRKLIKRGELKSYRIGTRHRIAQKEIMRYLNREA